MSEVKIYSIDAIFRKGNIYRMKKGILIFAYGDAGWIGGTYYKRNIVFSLLQNEWICKKHNIVILSDEETIELFKCFDNFKNVFLVVGKSGELYLSAVFLKFHIRYSFPDYETHIGKLMRVHVINWIPDFQHKVYPENFSKEECEGRTSWHQSIVRKKNALVLSSNSAKSDFEKFYSPKEKTYIVPFVSYIEPELRQMDELTERKVIGKYSLTAQKYVCICNQFWKHKNHIVVLKAILALLEKEPKLNVKFVFTGALEDYRNPEYYKQILDYLQNEKIEPYVKVLGFIDRIEQLVLMKNAQFIIQPSLFEGWGTVVEDAKVLDKRVLLSDIPVHREQMNEKCELFNPHDPQELAYKIDNMLKTEDVGDINNGIKKMYENAKIYSKGFERLLRE